MKTNLILPVLALMAITGLVLQLLHINTYGRVLIILSLIGYVIFRFWPNKADK
jgi:hypothetical protein